jgi:hypothetical protein
MVATLSSCKGKSERIIGTWVENNPINGKTLIEFTKDDYFYEYNSAGMPFQATWYGFVQPVDKTIDGFISKPNNDVRDSLDIASQGFFEWKNGTDIQLYHVFKETSGEQKVGKGQVYKFVKIQDSQLQIKEYQLQISDSGKKALVPVRELNLTKR